MLSLPSWRLRAKIQCLAQGKTIGAGVVDAAQNGTGEAKEKPGGQPGSRRQSAVDGRP
jgi:hypothetical protein